MREAEITTHGTRISHFKQQLNGIMGFAFRNGALKGVDLNQLVREFKANGLLVTFKKEDYKAIGVDQKTEFGSLSGTAKIIKGVVNNPDLKLDSKHIDVDGEGTAGFIYRGIKLSDGT